MNAGDERDEAVSDHRRQAPRKKGIAAVLSPYADDVSDALDGLDYLRNFARIVLQVAVRRHDDSAAGMVEPGREGRCLPEVPSEADDRQMRIDRLQPRECLEALVGAAIVDDDALVRACPGAQRVRQF